MGQQWIINSKLEYIAFISVMINLQKYTCVTIANIQYQEVNHNFKWLNT